MRKMIVVAAALLGACQGGPAVKLGSAGDLARYQRVGVLPFQQPPSGENAGELVQRALRARGLQTVGPQTMGPLFDALRLQPGDELSLEQLVRVRERTHAQALVFGRLDPAGSSGREALLLLILDGESGDLVARAETAVPPADKGGRAAAIERLLDAIGAAGDRRRRERSSDDLEDP